LKKKKKNVKNEGTSESEGAVLEAEDEDCNVKRGVSEGR
jgi:hypothetical protein